MYIYFQLTEDHNIHYNIGSLINFNLLLRYVEKTFSEKSTQYLNNYLHYSFLFPFRVLKLLDTCFIIIESKSILQQILPKSFSEYLYKKNGCLN